MKFLQRKQIKALLAITGASAAIYGCYRLWLLYSSRRRSREKKEQETQAAKALEQQDEQDHIPFDELIQDNHFQEMGKGSIGYLQFIRDISYRVILCLMKGSSYQGIVIINFMLNNQIDQMQDFNINFNGIGIKFLLVNGHRFDPREIRYLDHRIKIPRQLIRQKSKNTIQIIFENNYSFLNEGLSAYFMVDQNNKYSLRQQVIYASNGYLQIQRIIPCINCLNQCKVQLQVIHPDTFQVISNASKSLQRFCSVAQYSKYPFLFDLSSNSLNRSFKLNSSSASATGINLSMGDSSSQYSASNFYNRKKANTHFYATRLASIHHLFIFSSAMTQLLPPVLNNPLEKEIMIRYYCKHSQSHLLQKSVSYLHSYIFETIKKLSSEGFAEYVSKIDIIIISDQQSEGYFAPGCIILSQKSLFGTVNIRCLYLIVRSLLGMLRMAKGQNVITLQEVLALNELVFHKFQQFRNYLYIEGLQLEKLRYLINCLENKDYLQKNQGFLLTYYSKQLKLLVNKHLLGNLSFEFSNLMQSFHPDTLKQFWQKFISIYNFLSPLIVEPLLELSIKRLGIPEDERLRQQLKICFNSSKYILSFYSNQEISDNLPKFMQFQAQGLEQRLTQLKIKQKFKDFITQRYEKYIPVKSNIAEAEAIYNQFKKFNQSKNFHHRTLLESEISRVACFGHNFIRPERVGVLCSVGAWRLLKRLKIYPSDEKSYQFLKIVDSVED